MNRVVSVAHRTPGFVQSFVSNHEALELLYEAMPGSRATTSMPGSAEILQAGQSLVASK